MPATIEYGPDDICVLRISGVWRRSELDARQKEIANKIDQGARPRLLAILENFEGWEKGVDWNDLDFLFSHSGRIERIAIVGDPRWEVQALAFAGAGFRDAPVVFFPAPEVRAGACLAGRVTPRRLRGTGCRGCTPAGVFKQSANSSRGSSCLSRR